MKYEKDARIYNDRPLECRALKCWDTRELEQIYAAKRLTRRDLISNVKGLWDLIEDHQVRCDYIKIRDLIADRRHDTKRDHARKNCWKSSAMMLKFANWLFPEADWIRKCSILCSAGR